MSELSKSIGAKLRTVREAAGASQSELETALKLGPGWIELYESGSVLPGLDALLAILAELDTDGQSFFEDAHVPPQSYPRSLSRTADGEDLRITFPYGKFTAVHKLLQTSVGQFDSVIDVLREGLAEAEMIGQDSVAAKSEAVASAFLEAVTEWPQANPSDLWYFVVYRAFLDRANHPASQARLNLEQSWKRTGGWALERVLVRHYAEKLASEGVAISMPPKEVIAEHLAGLELAERLEADKVDVLLTRDDGAFLGVVHVKASFAERRTDDVPMSRALVEAGYFSPLWTMDCKATPSAIPRNRGELGRAWVAGQPDNRSAKRKDIEDDGYFSGCFSYNLNTEPTPSDQITDSPIVVCNFNDLDDRFVNAVVAARH